jgi:uncharacterized membrane protein YkoI
MKYLLTALTLTFGLITGGAAAASDRHDGVLQLARGEVTVNDLMGTEDPRIKVPLSKAVADVRQETGGRVLSANTVRKEGLFVHRIKVLTPDKRVVIYEVDAGIAD